jgi:Cdc6-like AAA superfamily ATPase
MDVKNEVEELLKEIKEYRNDMVARNYPYQQISDIITRWEMRDFLEEAEKEKKELEESYQESIRQREERKAKEWVKGYNKWKKDLDGED